VDTEMRRTIGRPKACIRACQSSKPLSNSRPSETHDVARSDRASEFERRDKREKGSAFDEGARRVFGSFARANVLHPHVEETDQQKSKRGLKRAYCVECPVAIIHMSLPNVTA